MIPALVQCNSIHPYYWIFVIVVFRVTYFLLLVTSLLWHISSNYIDGNCKVVGDSHSSHTLNNTCIKFVTIILQWQSYVCWKITTENFKLFHQAACGIANLLWRQGLLEFCGSRTYQLFVGVGLFVEAEHVSIYVRVRFFCVGAEPVSILWEQGFLCE